MSIGQALSNAISGLSATTRGIETVSSNVANAYTPGYARRELETTSGHVGGRGGGVRVIGIDRVVNATVLAESRAATADKLNAQAQSAFFNRIEALVGQTGDVGSLGSRLGELRTALNAAAIRPDDPVRLQVVLQSASQLAAKLNEVSDGIQTARKDADAGIKSDVTRLNALLEKTALLNERIAALGSEGGDIAALQDQRQLVIDEISQIVPVSEVARDAGRVAIFSTSGAVLLDGTVPAAIEFSAAIGMNASMNVNDGSLSRLIFNGQALPDSRLSLLGGGSLGAKFDIRDDLAIKAQADIDIIARELHDRFADPAVDPTLGVTDAGLFTDHAARLDAADLNGFASRIAINPIMKSDTMDRLWHLRSGLGATAAGPVSDGTILQNMSDALDRSVDVSGPLGSLGNLTMTGLFSNFESALSGQRLFAETQETVAGSRASAMAEDLASGGVNTDAEMQRLLQYEQSYAANARVIQTIDDLIQLLMRM